MSLAATIIGGGIAGMSAMADSDRKRRERQNAINAATEQRIAQAELALLGNGPEARMRAADMDAERFKAAANEGQPVDWVPLVNALGTISAGAYDESKKPTVPQYVPSGEDVPGQNFTPASNYTPPVDVATWQPVAAPSSGSTIKDARRRYDGTDYQDLPGWLR